MRSYNSHSTDAIGNIAELTTAGNVVTVFCIVHGYVLVARATQFQILIDTGLSLIAQYNLCQKEREENKASAVHID